MAGMVIAVIMLARRNSAEFRVRFLLSQSVPLAVLFLFFSLNKAGKSNWTAPALIPGILMMVVYWREVVRERPVSRRGVVTAFAVAFIMTAVLHNTQFLRLPPKLDILRRAQGWPDMAAHVQRAREQFKVDTLIGCHYGCASLLAFYLPDHPRTYLPPQLTVRPNLLFGQATS